MNIHEYANCEPGRTEAPLDHLVTNGGFCGIFRKIGCIGDSLSSGEFESLDENGTPGYHDMFAYSWGQFLARDAGTTVLNFSRGGMTAKEYCDSFAQANHFWDEDKLCQAYIIALGVNDINIAMELGSTADIDREDPENNRETFAGYYAKIIQRLKAMQPQARFFLMTCPHDDGGEECNRKFDRHAALLHEIAAFFDYCYVLDLTRYAPVYDAAFKKKYYLGGHMNPAGYRFTAVMVASYIDYIIRSHFEDFLQVPFIGEPFHNCSAKW